MAAAALFRALSFVDASLERPVLLLDDSLSLPVTLLLPVKILGLEPTHLVFARRLSSLRVLLRLFYIAMECRDQ